MLKLFIKLIQNFIIEIINLTTITIHKPPSLKITAERKSYIQYQSDTNYTNPENTMHVLSSNFKADLYFLLAQ